MLPDTTGWSLHREPAIGRPTSHDGLGSLASRSPSPTPDTNNNWVDPDDDFEDIPGLVSDSDDSIDFAVQPRQHEVSFAGGLSDSPSLPSRLHTMICLHEHPGPSSNFVTFRAACRDLLVHHLPPLRECPPSSCHQAELMAAMRSQAAFLNMDRPPVVHTFSIPA